MTNLTTVVALEESMKGSARDAGEYQLSRSLVALDPQASAEAEAFRALRTHIMARHVEEGRRALAICAATTGVGCTYVAANLAVAVSQIGIKTLLIDANLRTPGIDQLFQPPGETVGLVQCLSSGGMFSDFIQPEVLPNLSLILAGGVPQNPQELLATDRFAHLINACLRDFDLTIIDTPAANRCSDVSRVSSVAGYSLVVARRNVSLLSDVKTLVSQLEGDRARVVGTVMTEQ